MTNHQPQPTQPGQALGAQLAHLAPPPSALPVVEAFGPTLQGEGPSAGRAAAFIRFGGCNLSCTWCDSAYTWDGSRYDLRNEIGQWSPDQILEALPAGWRAPTVILTGGEPLLHQDTPAWGVLLAGLATQGRTIEIETNGTRLPNEASTGAISRFLVSPKLGNAGQHRGHQDPSLHPGWTDLAQRADAHLKIVCQDSGDVARAVALADVHRWPASRVWVMPEGTSTHELAQRWPTIAATAADYGINATHRLHVLAWGDERGH